MEDVFIKKYWTEEDILFYLHFRNGEAVKQIEITPEGKHFLSLDNPVQDGLMLYDQDLEALQLDESDFITKQEFEKAWEDR